jgi:hypothetical protein
MVLVMYNDETVIIMFDVHIFQPVVLSDKGGFVIQCFQQNLQLCSVQVCSQQGTVFSILLVFPQGCRFPQQVSVLWARYF